MKTGKLKCNVVDLTKLLTWFFSNCTLAKDLLCRYDACFWAVHHRACVVLRAITALGVNEALCQATLHTFTCCQAHFTHF